MDVTSRPGGLEVGHRGGLGVRGRLCYCHRSKSSPSFPPHFMNTYWSLELIAIRLLFGLTVEEARDFTIKRTSLTHAFLKARSKRTQSNQRASSPHMLPLASGSVPL